MGKRRRLSPWQFFAVLGMFAAALLLFVGVVLCMNRDEREVDFEAEYYFLVENCEDSTAAAVAGKVYGRGGAGVTLEGGRAVVVACYYTVQDAERVQASMREKGVETKIEALSARKFDLHGEAAAHAERVKANAETVETCARLLYRAANGLERAEMGQAEAKTAARGAASSLAGLWQGNKGGFFDRWNAELAGAAQDCREVADGLVFAKDLRRIQAQLLCALVGLDAYF